MAKCLSLILLALAHLLLAATLSADSLRLTMTGAYRPFSSPDDSGTLVGFDVDIAREVARRLGREPEIIQVRWDGLPAHLQSGNSDLICGSMAITPPRLERMHFSLPYYVSGAQLFVRQGLDSVEGLRLGVTRGTTFEDFINNNPDQFPGTSVLTYESEAHIVAALRADKVDGFISDRIIGGFYINAGGGGIVPLGGLLYREACGIAARKDSGELVSQVNQALIDMVNDGTYTSIFHKWVGLNPDLEVLRESWGQHTAHIPALTDSNDDTDKPESTASFATGTGGMLSLLATGALLTLKLSLITVVAALLLGMLVGVAAASPRQVMRALADTYIWVVRGTPLLVQLFISYYVITWAINQVLGSDTVGAFGAALIALIVNTAAYNAETMRGAINGVDKGQWDAASALGMTRNKSLRRIILPQALRSAFPSLGNNFVVLIKDTSLVGAITLIELTYAAQNIVTQSGQPFLPFMLAAAFYLAIISSLSVGMRLLERRISRSVPLASRRA